jgi:putative ABC transport system substrate-binding protein
MRRREVLAWLAGSVAAAAPRASQAQTAVPVTGFMSGRSPTDSAHVVAAFRQGLRDAEFTEGQNVSLEF